MRRLLVIVASVVAFLAIEEGFGHQIDVVSYLFGVGIAFAVAWGAHS